MNQPLLCITAIDLLMAAVFVVFGCWGTALSYPEQNWRMLRYWQVIALWSISALAGLYPILSRT